MKKINWTQVVLEVIRIIVAAMAGGGAAAAL